jgi:hypothetical protein
MTKTQKVKSKYGARLYTLSSSSQENRIIHYHVTSDMRIRSAQLQSAVKIADFETLARLTDVNP